MLKKRRAHSLYDYAIWSGAGVLLLNATLSLGWGWDLLLFTTVVVVCVLVLYVLGAVLYKAGYLH